MLSNSSPERGGGPPSGSSGVEGAPSVSPAARVCHLPVPGRILLVCLLLASCRAHPSDPHFPSAHRDVAPTVSSAFSTEDARDRLGEAEQVMKLAGVTAGMWVADVGAGQGYYTVRLARVVGPQG